MSVDMSVESRAVVMAAEKADYLVAAMVVNLAVVKVYVLVDLLVEMRGLNLVPKMESLTEYWKDN